MSLKKSKKVQIFANFCVQLSSQLHNLMIFFPYKNLQRMSIIKGTFQKPCTEESFCLKLFLASALKSNEFSLKHPHRFM